MFDDIALSVVIKISWSVLLGIPRIEAVPDTASGLQGYQPLVD